ncbi:hypothetical protein PT974_04608 [Cladobotryum mycophilum]|uniref:Amidohydrolase-related domain-containing protein n=1 Tax=Cladobotryum mycophilum TaxID=491253 RepID=A0ABR0SWN3_9HYPO
MTRRIMSQYYQPQGVSTSSITDSTSTSESQTSVPAPVSTSAPTSDPTSSSTTPATEREEDWLPRTLYSPGLGLTLHTTSDGHASSTKKQPSHTIITSKVLIPGDGRPIKNGAIVVEGKLIVWVGPKSLMPQKYTEAPHQAHSVPYLMPGLWDCHVHCAGQNPDPTAAGPGALSENPASSGARLTRQCWEALQRGYTSLRDVAGFGCEVAQAVADGSIMGPNIYSSGACLSQRAAGHGDIFSLPVGDVLTNLGVQPGSLGYHGLNTTVIADGAEECLRAVRLQIQRGAKCIKVLASGGVLSRDDNPLRAQFSQGELEAIVEEASRMDRAVAAHVHGKPDIMAAVKAGVTTVEHVTFADQECIDLIKGKGVVYVATRTVLEILMASGGEGLPHALWEKAQLCNANHMTAYKLAVQNGVTIALGSDTFPGYNMARELEHAVEAGLSNLEAIKAATANGPLTVKGQAPLTGQLKVGYEADILGVLESPIDDVKVLQKKSNINWVWKGGRLFKGPGIGPWGEELKVE